MKKGKEFKVNLDGKFYAVMGLDALVKMLNTYGKSRVSYELRDNAPTLKARKFI